MRWWFLLFFSYPVFASQWYTGEASMPIGDAPLEQIREQTIKNAIANASYMAGAMVSAEEVSLNGVIVGSQVLVESQGAVRRVKVLSEQVQDNVLTVIVDVDLAVFHQCEASQYRRHLLVSPFVIQSPHHTKVGGLVAFGQHVGKRFEQQINLSNYGFKAHLLGQVVLRKPPFELADQQTLTAKAEYLAREYGTQYVLFGYLRDISLFNQTERQWSGDETQIKRNFTMRLYVMDVFQSRIVMEESYHVEADWDFDLYQPVDLNSSLFWQSAYGRSVLGSIADAIVDVTDNMQCEPQLGQIIARHTDGFIINLGKHDGLQIGDEFAMHQSFGYRVRSASPQQFLNLQDDTRLSVIALSATTAKITPQRLGQGLEGQVFDLVSPATFHSRARKNESHEW